MIGRMTEGPTFFEKPAGAETELEAPVREKVDCRGLLRQRDRVGDDQGDDRDAQPHTLRRSRDETKRGHRVSPRGVRVP